MTHETKISLKLEEETKSIKKMCEQLSESIENEFSKGVEHIETEEMKEAIDMLKDLYEIKKSMMEACYYKKIIEAMEESEYDEDYDWQGRMYYRGQPRDSMGRYTGRGGRRRGYEDMMMPMDYREDILYPIDHPYGRGMEPEMGRMYYDDGRSSGGQGDRQGGSRSGSVRPSRYGFAYDQYMENREKHSKSSPEENSKRIELLNDFIEDLEDMAKDVVKGMSPEEKQVWKIKLNKLTSM